MTGLLRTRLTTLLGLLHWRRRNLADGTPKGVLVLGCSVLASRVNELLTLGAGVFVWFRGFGHWDSCKGFSMNSLVKHREVSDER